MTAHRATTPAAARRRDKRARQAAADLHEVLADAVASQTTDMVKGFKTTAQQLGVTGTMVFATGSDPTPPVQAKDLWNHRRWDDALTESELHISRFVVRELDVDFGLQVTGEQPFVQGLTSRLVSLIEDWTLDFKNLVSNVIDRGHAQLKSVDQVAKDLRAAGVKTANQATTIARTQMIAASNNANYYGATTFAGPGDTKEWVATPDSRTRKDHRDAHGQTVPFDEPFIVGGERGMHPGDSSFSPAQLINCRCTFTWIPAEDNTPPPEVPAGNDLRQVGRAPTKRQVLSGSDDPPPTRFTEIGPWLQRQATKRGMSDQEADLFYDSRSQLARMGGYEVEDLKGFKAGDRAMDALETQFAGSLQKSQALDDYVSGTAYREINGALRSGEQLGDELQAVLDGVEATMEPLPAVRVFRGVDPEAVFGTTNIDDLVGVVFEDDAMVSTTVAPGFAQSWVSTTDVIMDIEVPAGVKGVFIDKGADTRFETAFEVILGRGNKFRVAEVLDDRTLRIEVIG